MADILMYMTPPVDRRGPIIKTFPIKLTTADHLRVYTPEINGVDQVWSLIAGRLELVCSAEVQNRAIRLYRAMVNNEGVGYASGLWNAATIAAGETKAWCLDQIPAADNTEVGVNETFYTNLGPEGLKFHSGQQLTIYIGNWQTGDVLSGYLTFQYLNWKLGLK